ncbi:MAG TPA: dipeptide/oligopeptide/nickel ABC transporter permease/ATP-binding protein [Blastococcus sp.]|nr:dipeptide/oligopeptide/nickel ABC transporter permease/ATP-binding protein [Blastococcus sp.]
MTATSAHVETVLAPVPPVTGSGPHWVRRAVRHQPLGVAAAAYLVLLVLAGVLAPVLAPYDPAEQDLNNVLGGPSGSHWLGTDTLGRDVLSRLLYGIEPSLVNSLIAVAVFLVLGVPLGILAGYRGGWADGVISRVVELALVMPPIILVLVALSVFADSPTAAMVTLGALASTGLIRVVRAATLQVREEAFVTAARISGVRPLRIMTSHVLRRVTGPILVQASVFAGITLAAQAALAFLGLISSGGRPTWGGMIAEASQVISQDQWLLVPAGVAIGVTVLAFGLLGDAIRDLSSGEEAAAATRGPRKTTRTPAAGSAADRVRTAPADALLVVDGLSVTAGSEPGTPLVSDVSFGVGPGQTVALVGESGCGKSVTALALLGLLPAGVSVSGGSVTFNGTDLAGGGPQAYRAIRGSGIGYVAQDALGSLDPTHTVGSHLLEVIRVHERLGRAATMARAVELLHQVKLTDTDRVLASYPHEISGGMAQRINIALALAGRPQLLIADEPTTALDVTVQAEILQLLRELQHATGMAILIITHDWGVVADIADRAVVMYAGEVVELADIHALFTRPRFPYSAALLAADPSTAHEGARLPTLPGRVPAPGSWPVGCRFAGRCAHVREECTSGPLPLITADDRSTTRCTRVEELVQEGALPQ